MTKAERDFRRSAFRDEGGYTNITLRLIETFDQLDALEAQLAQRNERIRRTIIELEDFCSVLTHNYPQEERLHDWVHTIRETLGPTDAKGEGK